ncbi:MAG: ABC transporter substrate-binding protein [Candidatus Woesearchaeota archaeon]
MKTQTIAVIVLFVLTTMLIAGCTSKSSQTIKVGFISPLSTDAAIIGVQQMNAVKLAVDEINAEGGINGKQLEVIYEDSKCDGKEAVNAVNKLISVDNVHVILGDICSGATLAVKPITEENAVLMFTWGSSPDVTKNSSYIVRNSPADDSAGKELAQYIYSHGTSKLAVLTLNSDFTNALLVPLKQEFERLGGTIVAYESLDPSASDFRASVTKIKQGSPDAIVVLGTDPANTGAMVRQVREQGLEQQLYSAYAFSAPSAVEAAGSENAKGLVYLDAPSLNESNNDAESFIEKYTSTYGSTPQGSEFYAAAAYDSVYIIKDALLACGQDTGCMKNEITGTEFNGALGSYGFTESGDVRNVGFSMNRIE